MDNSGKVINEKSKSSPKQSFLKQLYKKNHSRTPVGSNLDTPNTAHSLQPN